MDVLAVLGSLANGFGALISAVLQAWLLVHAARRVLGVPVGWIRSFAVSFLTLGVFFAIVSWLLEAGRIVMSGNADELSKTEDIKRVYLGG